MKINLKMHHPQVGFIWIEELRNITKKSSRAGWIWLVQSNHILQKTHYLLFYFRVWLNRKTFKPTPILLPAPCFWPMPKFYKPTSPTPHTPKFWLSSKTYRPTSPTPPTKLITRATHEPTLRTPTTLFSRLVILLVCEEVSPRRTK